VNRKGDRRIEIYSVELKRALQETNSSVKAECHTPLVTLRKSSVCPPEKILVPLVNFLLEANVPHLGTSSESFTARRRDERSNAASVPTKVCLSARPPTSHPGTATY